MNKIKKPIYWLMIAAMLFTLVPASAFAVTDNQALSVPKVQDDKDGQALGTLLIKEDSDNEGYFYDGDRITITLPSGVEYDNITDDLSVGMDSVNDAVYLNEYVEISGDNSVGGTLALEVKAVTEKYLTVEVQGDSDQDTNEAAIKFYFGQGGKNSTVDIDNGVSGDIKVEVDADGTSVSSGYVTVARIVGGDTTTTISDVESCGIDTTSPIGAIKISENALGVLVQSTASTAGGSIDTDLIELELPNDFEWKNVGPSNIASVGLNATYVSGVNTDTLKIAVGRTTENDKQPGFITITGAEVYVPDDADEGEFEMTIDGNEVTKETIVIGEAGDYGFTVKVVGDLKTVVAGKDGQEVNEIEIDDVVASSWIAGRMVKLELPSWAHFESGYTGDFGPISFSSINDDDDEDYNELKLVVDNGADGKAELDDLEVRIDADAPVGDLTLKISGSAGVEDEVVIAKVVAPFEVTAEVPEFVIGVQDQELGEITLAETTEGAVKEGKWIIIEAPKGMEFAEVPVVKVTEGDMEIDDEDIDDNFFAFKVSDESNKSASVIEISNIVMNLDRTVPVGDIDFEINMTKTKEIDNVSDFDDAIVSDNYEEVTEVVVGKVVTPAPGAGSAEFTIGSTIYYVDGKANVLEAAPYIKDGRTYIPVRAAAEATGAVVEYDQATKTVTATKDGKEVTMVIGQVGASGVAPEVINGRTFVPIRDLEALGLTLGYDQLTKKVVVQ